VFLNRNVEMCQDNSVLQFPRKCVAMCPNNNVPMCQDKSVSMFQVSSVPTFLRLSVKMFQHNSVVRFVRTSTGARNVLPKKTALINHISKYSQTIHGSPEFGVSIT